MSLKQHDLISDQDHVEVTVEIHPYQSQQAWADMQWTHNLFRVL